MKNITVSVNDETSRLVQAQAAKYGTSVSGMIGEYLNNLTAGTKESPQVPKRTLSEIIPDIRAKGGGLRSSDNLSREELHDRNALR